MIRSRALKAAAIAAAALAIAAMAVVMRSSHEDDEAPPGARLVTGEGAGPGLSVAMPAGRVGLEFQTQLHGTRIAIVERRGGSRRAAPDAAGAALRSDSDGDACRGGFHVAGRTTIEGRSPLPSGTKCDCR